MCLPGPCPNGHILGKEKRKHFDEAHSLLYILTVGPFVAVDHSIPPSNEFFAVKAIAEEVETAGPWFVGTNQWGRPQTGAAARVAK